MRAFYRGAAPLPPGSRRFDRRQTPFTRWLAAQGLRGSLSIPEGAESRSRGVRQRPRRRDGHADGGASPGRRSEGGSAPRPRRCRGPSAVMSQTVAVVVWLVLPLWVVAADLVVHLRAERRPG